MDLVSQVVLVRGGKYNVSVGVGAGSEVSEEQLMQKIAKTSNSIDFDMVIKVGFG
jgi:hypothetical protein